MESSSSSAAIRLNDLTEDQYKDIPTYYLDRLDQYRSFKAETKGSTVAKVLFIETTQSIVATAIKEEYRYYANESHSNIVNTVHFAYYHNGQAVYRDSSEGDYSQSSMDDYLNVYGVDPFERCIEGYIINEESVRSITKSSEDASTFLLSLDPEKATNNVRIQMRKFGGLDDYPSFSKIEISMNLCEDFTPHSLHVHAEYKAKKIMESDCVQDYDVTFTSFDETIDVPNLSEVKQKHSF